MRGAVQINTSEFTAATKENGERQAHQQNAVNKKKH